MSRRQDIAKLAFALLIFCFIVGGWLVYERYRDATTALPDDHAGNSPCVLWFIGSSSIHRWTSLDRDMAPWVAHNRGINSATYLQILPRFAHIRPQEARPAAIILYAGENDIASGIPVRTTIHNFSAFLNLRDQLMPGIPVLALSAKPSPGRWQYLAEQRLLNEAARRLIPQFGNVHYVDITTALMKNGRLGDNYRADGVHMNEAGYRIWANVVRTRLRDVMPVSVLRRCDT